MYEEEFWDPVEREAVSDTYLPFLDYSDLELYIWYIFIGTGWVHGRYSWRVFYDHLRRGARYPYVLIVIILNP